MLEGDRMNLTNSGIYYFLIFFLIALDLNFLNLVNVQTFHVGILYYTDFVFFINLMVCFIQLLHDKSILYKNNNLKFILIVCFFIIISSITGHYTYTQTIFSGIVAQREWFSWMLLIYPMSRWINTKKITIGGIKQVIITLCDIYAIICIVQFFLYNKVQFTYATVNNRYGSVRFYFNTAFFAFSIGNVADSILIEKEKKLINTIRLISYMFVILVITKGRMAVLSLLAAICTCMLGKKKINNKKKIIIIFFILLGLIIFGNTTMGKDIFNLFNGTSLNDTLSIRDAARDYYFKLFSKSWENILFGCGVGNTHNIIARNILNPLWQDYGSSRFYLEDVGIISPLIKYGLIGVFCWLFLMGKYLFSSFYIYKSTGEIKYLQYLIMDIISSVTLVPTLFNTTMLFPIIIVMIRTRYKEIISK